MHSDCSEDAPMTPSLEWTLEESRAATGVRRLSGHGQARPAADELAEASERCEPALSAPGRWGLSAAAVAHLGDRLSQCWLRLRGCVTTRTRDTSAHADDSLRAQVTLDTERHLANRDRPLQGGEGQALQHCMANAPWSGPAVFAQSQAESTAPPALAHGSPWSRDERAEEQAGTHNAGASRQDKGRLGQVAVGRVDTCLPSANGGLGALVDGALCLPEEWCGAACAQRRQERGMPVERRLETQLPLGLKRIPRV